MASGLALKRGQVLVFLMWCFFAPGTALKAADRTLVLLTWEDYIDPEIVAEFEQQNDASIRFVYYEDDDARDLIMANSNASGFDLVLVDETMQLPYKQQGWLSAIDTGSAPNLKYVEHYRGGPHLSGTVYAVPYFWGTVGILYYPDRFPKPIQSWKDYFQPSANLTSQLLALNTAQTMFGIALKALGYSANSDVDAELDEAAALLRRHRPYVSEYRNVLFDKSEPLLKGQLAAALVYNGDAVTLMEMNADLRFILPKEGSIYWYDSWVILSSSTQTELAEAFLDFINRPAINARNAEFVFYATSNTAAKKLLPKEHLSNSVIYPDANTTEQLEIPKLLPLEVMKRIHSDFVSITHSRSWGAE